MREPGEEGTLGPSIVVHSVILRAWGEGGDRSLPTVMRAQESRRQE